MVLDALMHPLIYGDTINSRVEWTETNTYIEDITEEVRDHAKHYYAGVYSQMTVEDGQKMGFNKIKK